jgi:protein-L-isoaspartate(D-aspartate) O-methyltransferase
MNRLLINLDQGRERMLDRQIAHRGVRRPRVLEAMRAVPREAFVPEELAEFAYEDRPLPIGEGQTISQPYIVGLMAELPDPAPKTRCSMLARARATPRRS